MLTLPKAGLAGSAILIIAAMFLWQINDATGDNGVPDAAGFFIAIMAMLTGAIFWGRERIEGGLRGLSFALIATVSVMLISGVVMMAGQSDHFAKYIMGDSTTLGCVMIAYLAISRNRSFIENPRVPAIIGLLFTLVAILAPIFSRLDLRPAYHWMNRYDPPHMLAFGFFAARLAVKPEKWISSSAALFGLLVLAYVSGNRTSVVLSIAACSVLALSNWRLLLFGFIGVASIAFLDMIGILPIGEMIEGGLSQSRFGLLSGGVDDSLMGRFREVFDIWRITRNESSLFQIVFGHGFGATWHQFYSFVSAGWVADGHIVQYIHIGPVALFYRYGVPGVLFVVLILALLIRDLPAILRPKEAGMARVYWYLATLAMWANLWAQNSLYNPPFVISLAAYLIVRSQGNAAHALARRGRVSAPDWRAALSRHQPAFRG